MDPGLTVQRKDTQRCVFFFFYAKAAGHVEQSRSNLGGFKNSIYLGSTRNSDGTFTVPVDVPNGQLILSTSKMGGGSNLDKATVSVPNGTIEHLFYNGCDYTPNGGTRTWMEHSVYNLSGIKANDKISFGNLESFTLYGIVDAIICY